MKCLEVGIVGLGVPFVGLVFFVVMISATRSKYFCVCSVVNLVLRGLIGFGIATLILSIIVIGYGTCMKSSVQ